MPSKFLQKQIIVWYSTERNNRDDFKSSTAKLNVNYAVEMG